MTRIACVNADRGIAPGRAKGAAVHVAAMRAAFERCGADVVAVDAADEDAAARDLRVAHAVAPLDAVYERYALGCEAPSRWCEAALLPHVLEVNAPLLDEAARHRGREVSADDLLVERRIFERAARILAVSGAVAEYVARHGIGRDRIAVRPNGVDADRFRPAPADAVPPFPLPRDRFVVGFHGRLRPWHGFELLVEAIAEARRRGIPVLLVCVGDGPFEEHLAGLDPGDYRCVGWRAPEQVAEYVAWFDALVLSYPPDEPCYFSPLKLFEAMAAGAVPIVPDLGDLRDWVTDGRDGIVVAAGDREAVVVALARLAGDTVERRRLSAAAVRTAGTHSWDGIARDVLAWTREARSA